MRGQSAGLIPYRYRHRQLEIFLVHMGGPYWARKDLAAWSIAKGEHAPDEDPLEAAKREFREETGFTVDAESFEPLSPLRQPGGKTVVAWAFEGDFDPSDLHSNAFKMEWPPKSGRIAEFPEVDQGGWFSVSEAKEKILKGQVALIDELCEKLRR